MKAFSILKLTLVILAISTSNCFLSSVIDSVKSSVASVANTVKNTALDLLSTKTASISGECNYEGKKSNCQILASRNFGLEISGGEGNYPDFFKTSGKVIIPYVHIVDITSAKSKSFFSFSVSYVLTINRLGSKFTLTIIDTAINIDTEFVTIIKNNRAYYLDLLKNLRNRIQKSAEQLSVENSFLKANPNDVNGLAKINKDILDTTNLLTTKLFQRSQAELLALKLAPEVESRRIGMDSIKQKLASCISAVDTTDRLIQSYKKAASEYSEEKRYEFLNREQYNLCKFHMQAEDLTLILPNKSLDINRLRAEVVKNRRIDNVQTTFTGNDFFINK